MHRLNGWQRIGIVLSVAWAVFLAGVTVVDLNSTFNEELERWKGCPRLGPHHFATWEDAKTGKPITLHEDGEKRVSCFVVQQRAAALLRDAGAGLIEPRMTVMSSQLAFAVLVPVAAVWLLVYLVVELTRWVLDGFRKGRSSA
ncbi:hypothetical protein GCM10027034_19070 [Ramlibacter solisilvae]|uniref:Uncharacterized protein n=1 Tax=Ramlibacter tataouinensis TaxID=94132 RepID=A0A127JVE4_9BURK|nr:hypothetical protein UC35_15355 [Ramlibacter tataouinensis]